MRYATTSKAKVSTPALGTVESERRRIHQEVRNMAQYRDDPMTDEEFDELREKMDETREAVREYLDAQGVDVSQWDDSRTEARADGGE